MSTRKFVLLLIVAALLGVCLAIALFSRPAEASELQTVYIPLVENDTFNCPPGTIREGEGCLGTPPQPPTRGAVCLYSTRISGHPWDWLCGADVQRLETDQIPLEATLNLAADLRSRKVELYLFDETLRTGTQWAWIGDRCGVGDVYCIEGLGTDHLVITEGKNAVRGPDAIIVHWERLP